MLYLPSNGQRCCGRHLQSCTRKTLILTTALQLGEQGGSHRTVQRLSWNFAAGESREAYSCNLLKSFSFCQFSSSSPGYLYATNQCQMFIHMYAVRRLSDWKKGFISCTLHWRAPACDGNTWTGNCMYPKDRPNYSLWCGEQHVFICCGMSFMKWSCNELKISTFWQQTCM